MSRKKTNNEVSLIRSSAAEYLTFVAASGHGGVEAVYADESIWLSQKMMGVLYDVETHTINYHLKPRRPPKLPQSWPPENPPVR